MKRLSLLLLALWLAYSPPRSVQAFGPGVTEVSEKITNKTFDEAELLWKKAKEYFGNMDGRVLIGPELPKPAKYLSYETTGERFKYKVTDMLIGRRKIPLNRLVENMGDDIHLPRGGYDDGQISFHRKYYLDRGHFEKPFEVIVTPKGYLISDGHHKLVAAKQLRLRTVWVVVLEK
jgi:hypothetical protein